MAEKCVKTGQERDECIFYQGEICARPEDVPDECRGVTEKKTEAEFDCSECAASDCVGCPVAKNLQRPLTKQKEYETEQVPITKIKVGDKIFSQGYLFEVKKVWNEVDDGVLVIRFSCDGVKGDREPPVGYRENITLGGRYDLKIDTVIERDFGASEKFERVWPQHGKTYTRNNCGSCANIQCPVKEFACQSGPVAEHIGKMGLKCKVYRYL